MSMFQSETRAVPTILAAVYSDSLQGTLARCLKRLWIRVIRLCVS